MTSVNTDTCHLDRCPYRVAGEQLVVGRDTCEFNDTQFQYEVVDDLLSLGLCNHAVLQVTLSVDIKECADTSY